MKCDITWIDIACYTLYAPAVFKLHLPIYGFNAMCKKCVVCKGLISISANIKVYNSHLNNNSHFSIYICTSCGVFWYVNCANTYHSNTMKTVFVLIYLMKITYLTRKTTKFGDSSFRSSETSILRRFIALLMPTLHCPFISIYIMTSWALMTLSLYQQYISGHVWPLHNCEQI